MGKKDRQLEQIIRMMQAQMNRINTPDPNIEALKGFYKGIIDWNTSPGNTIKDIAKHPTIGSKLPIYQLAKMNRNKGRIGRGIAGIQGSGKSGYSEEMALEDEFDRSQMASGLLETGLQQELGGALQGLAGLGGLDLQRLTAGSSMLSGMASTASQLSNGGGWGGFLRGILGGIAPALGGI